MEKKKLSGITIFTKQITSTVSVTLVLLILGIIAALAIATKSITDEIREKVGFTVILKEDISENEIDRLTQTFATADYVSGCEYTSADENLARWEEENGEDIMQVLGVNPFSGEFDVRVTSDYASVDSISLITAGLEALPTVDKVEINLSMIDGINRNMRVLTIALVLVAVALLLISFVLINNTVRLTVYSRRFIIHTMRLVGATPGFIRRPFIKVNILHGIIAAVVASLLLAALLGYARSIDPAVGIAVPWSAITWVFAALLGAGIVICSIAALFATNKYLYLDYDDMF